MHNILHLPAFRVLELDETEHDYHISVETIKQPIGCVHCGVVGQLVGFGTREQHFFDLPSHGKRVGLRLRRRRFRCKECGKTFFEPLADMDSDHMMTKRLVQYIQSQSLRRTFAGIADDIGVDEKTVRNIFHTHADRLEASVNIATPTYLGIDEVYVIRRPRCILTNVQENTVVDLLPDRNKPTVLSRLALMPGKERIEAVCMDMWKQYRQAVHVVLPQAQIVVDKFHVVRLANYALEAIRKEVRKDLTAKQRKGLMHDRFVLLKRQHSLTAGEQLVLDLWADNHPALRAGYDLKEAFYGLWDAASKPEARERYREWVSRIPSELTPFYKDVLSAMENWNAEVFAYWDHPISNGYTEGLNGLVKLVARNGRGYSFEALRAKMLFSEGMHKHKRPKYEKHPQAVHEEPEVGEWTKVIFESLGIEFSTLNTELAKDAIPGKSTRKSG